MKNTDLHFKMLKFIALKDNIYKSILKCLLSYEVMSGSEIKPCSKNV